MMTYLLTGICLYRLTGEEMEDGDDDELLAECRKVLEESSLPFQPENYPGQSSVRPVAPNKQPVDMNRPPRGLRRRIEESNPQGIDEDEMDVDMTSHIGDASTVPAFLKVAAALAAPSSSVLENNNNVQAGTIEAPPAVPPLPPPAAAPSVDDDDDAFSFLSLMRSMNQ